MLNVNTLPNRKDRILKTFEGPRQLRWRRKRTVEGKKRFQNKCVSSQNHRYKKRRGRYRSGVSPTFSQRAVWRSVCRAERAAFPRKLYFTGKPHKIPQMSYLRRETPAIFSHLIDSPKQMKQMNKDAE